MRFTISHHTGYGGEHYDFLLEQEGAERLKAWRISSVEFADPEVAIQNFDHRKIYLDYEGEITEGRGRVTIWDTGTYETKSWTDREIVISLRGRKLSGIVCLSCGSETPGENSRWLLELNPTGASPSTDGSAS